MLHDAQTGSRDIALAMSSAVGGGGQRHAPATLSPGKPRYPLHRRLGGPQGLFTGVEDRKSLANIGFQTPKHPAPKESPYRLRYTGP
jgi:hypothetical protein